MYRVTIIRSDGKTTVHEYADEKSARSMYNGMRFRFTARFERIELDGVGRTMNRNKTLETYYRWELEKWVKAVEDRDLEKQKRVEKSLVKLQKQALSCGCLETLTKQRRAIK